ncbi:hypothetical protein BH20CHL6_BH20CHL6_09240 [soil metagenome]
MSGRSKDRGGIPWHDWGMTEDSDRSPEGGAEPEADAEASASRSADDAERLEALAERETAYGLLQRGKALLKRRHHAQAAVVLERAARLEPGKGSIVEALGRAYYNSGQHLRAADTFEELLTIDPSAAYGHFGLGQALKQLGRRDEARTHLRLAVALAPESTLYRNALARLG